MKAAVSTKVRLSSDLRFDRQWLTADRIQAQRPDTGLRQADTLGAVHFEISNHLGNVVAVVSDRKIAVDTLSPFVIDHFLADRIMLRDYYAFGMTMPGRTWAVDSSYRFGFNGKENLAIAGWQDYGMRIFDRRISRFISADPLIVYGQQYAYLSSYQFAGNTPIQAIDLDGLEPEEPKNVPNNPNIILRQEAPVIGQKEWPGYTLDKNGHPASGKDVDVKVWEWNRASEQWLACEGCKLTKHAPGFSAKPHVLAVEFGGTAAVVLGGEGKVVIAAALTDENFGEFGVFTSAGAAGGLDVSAGAALSGTYFTDKARSEEGFNWRDAFAGDYTGIQVSVPVGGALSVSGSYQTGYKDRALSSEATSHTFGFGLSVGIPTKPFNLPKRVDRMVQYGGTESTGTSRKLWSN